MNVPPSSFRLQKSRHAAPQVFEHLREQIMSLALTPGTVLSRANLVAEFGVSQTPIRDALTRLAEEGLVDIYPQHATVVCPINIALAKQAHFLRRSVEGEVVYTLAGLADAPRAALTARLGSILARQAAMLKLDDFKEFSGYDQLFHKEMYDAAEVPDLWQLVRRQSGHLDRLRRLHLPIAGKADAILEDHRKILDAIAQGDPMQAQSMVRAHLSGTLANVDEIRSRYPAHIT
jgi:GntR family transcriptional regulator, rspAB operon transcriptional repressor